MALSSGSSVASGSPRPSPSFDSDFNDLFLEDLSVDPSCDLFPPDYDDEQERIREEEAERLKREAEEAKRRQAEEEMVWRREKHDSVIKSIREYEPKAKCDVWTRYPFQNFGFFDIDEESPVPPMRHSGEKYDSEDQLYHRMRCSVNILSFKIVSSDVGYPINVYGTLIARDNIDYKCIYLFRRNRRNSLHIQTQDESLILIGPSRGFHLQDYIFLEVDLKIKGDRGEDKPFSKILLSIDGRIVTRQKVEVRSISEASKLSTVEIEYAVVHKAVEATIEVRVVNGVFFGEITAHTTSIPNKMVLYDCKRGGVVTSDGYGTIQLWRSVVSVSLKDILIFTIVTQVSNDVVAASVIQDSNDAATSSTVTENNNDSTLASTRIEFMPKLCGANEYEFWCGGVVFHMRLTWSVINRLVN